MTDRPFSRRDLLFGAGAATIAGLAGCAPDASSFLSGTPSSLARIAPLSRVAPEIIVSKPTGEAIQQAINSLGSTGGTVYLTAKVPYIIDKSLSIPYNNIKLIGSGASVTQLVAKPGAVLTVSGHREEYLLIAQGATGIELQGLLVDTINEANSSGNPRIGIGIWNCKAVDILQVAFLHNLGPNPFNKALGVYQSSGLVVGSCEVLQSRTGIYLSNTSKFAVHQCVIKACAAEGPSFSGPNAAVFFEADSSGALRSCLILENKVNAGVLLNKSNDVLIESNKIQKMIAFHSGSGNRALQITEGGSIAIEANQFVGNSGSAAEISGATNVGMTQNFILDTADVGQVAGVAITGDTDTIKVTANHISRTRRGTYPGIDAGNSRGLDTNGQILGNSVHGFGTGVALGSNSKSYLVENNDLRYNTTCVSNTGHGNRLNNNLC